MLDPLSSIAALASPAPSLVPCEDTAAKLWLTRICARDEQALRQLHDAFGQRLYRCVLNIVRREEVAHEVVSTSFMQVWTTAACYDPVRGPVIAWLTLIARSRSLDALRRARQHRLHEVSVDEVEDGVSFEGIADPAMEPSVDIARRHRDRWVQRALLRLSPMQRQVVSLTAMDGLSHDEASRHLGLPLGTIKSHSRRGLASLRKRCEAIGVTVG